LPEFVWQCKLLRQLLRNVFVSAASHIIAAKRNRVEPDMAGKQFFVSRTWGWFCDMMEVAEQLEKVNPLLPAIPAMPGHTI
jgi:hypothetical protein